MSLPPGTEMFQFPGFASPAYGFSGRSPLPGGLPHSDIHGSTPARGSPWLFAACHVLHRLLVPRHPPNALLALENEPTPRGTGLAHHAQEPSTRISRQLLRFQSTEPIAPSVPPRNTAAPNSAATLLAPERPQRPGRPHAQTMRRTCRSDMRPLAARPETHQNLINPDKDHGTRTRAPKPGPFCVHSLQPSCLRSKSPSPRHQPGGDDRIRTDDPLLAKQVLSHLSYAPEQLSASVSAFRKLTADC